jgi:hypothetical protein
MLIKYTFKTWNPADIMSVMYFSEHFAARQNITSLVYNNVELLNEFSCHNGPMA